MKTLLINPDVPKLYQFGGQCAFPLGLGYIAAVLEKRRDVKVIDVGAERLNDDSLRKTILKMNPEIVGITSDTLAFQRAVEIATIVKQIDKKIIVVIGGVHSNALPTYPLKFDCFDISVYGEGERTAVELWDRIDKGKSYEDVKGICFRGKDGIVVNPKRELIENLDELPFPARHLFPMDKYSSDIHLAARPTYSIGTSRGCPFSCAFCSCNVAFGRKCRFRSPKNVVDEIELLINQYKVKGIYFREDLFTVNKQRVIDICDEIGKRGLHFSWECESRVDTIDEEMLRVMKKAGCELIWYGVESGSQRILDYLNKQITLSQVRKAFDICHKVGIKTGASFMIGIPGETIDEIQESIDLAEELKPKFEWAHFNVFTAFPTSPLYEFVKENRLYEKEVNHGILITKTDEFNRKLLEEIGEYANARINRRQQMSSEELEHEYNLEKLQLITPKKRDFKMLVTPRCTYLSQNAHEDFTSDLLLNFLRDDTLFIDVGAHYGYYTLLVGTSHPNCKIIAFEPVLENCEILRRNIELNQLKNVKVHNTALSNKNETKKFNITEASECSGFHEHPLTKVYKVVELEAVTLDSLIKEAPKVPVIIKVDTEGHEICVLEGMDEILRNTADIKLIVEFNPKCLRIAGYEPSDLLKKILQFGFEIYFVDDDKRVVYKLAENNIEGWRDYVLEKSSTPGVKTYINLLCVKTPEELNKILCSDKLSYAQYGQRDDTQGERFKLLSHLIEGQRVLEIGCGNGDLSVEIARLGFDVVGVDISKPRIRRAIELAKQENLDARAQFMVMDATTSLEFSENSFDTALIPEALAHIRDSRKLLEEAVRVVRNGGRIVLSVPNVLVAPFQGVPFQGHLRVFFKDTLTTELSQYAEEIQWHELPFKKWLVCSSFVKKPQLDITEGPLIDILMPTYNGRQYIRNAIKSVINQTYRNWNLVVVNDGGEDVADIIDEFRDTRIKYITAEHKGKAHALNVGIRNSSGKFISYLDDDDILYPIHLEVLLKAALEGKKDFVYSDWYEVSLDEYNREIGRQFEFRQDVAPWMLIPQNYINHKCILHKRSLFIKAGTYDEELHVLIDWDMIRRLSFTCPPHHLWSATSERIRYYSKGSIDNRISSVWGRDPEKASKSVERIMNKTRDLSATAEELKEAVIRAMLFISYYHQFEINRVLGARNSWIANLEASLQEKVSHINRLESQIQQIQHSIPMQVANRYQRIVERLLRPGTCRRRFYELGLSSIRVILTKGWKGFLREVLAYLRGKREGASKQP